MMYSKYFRKTCQILAIKPKLWKRTLFTDSDAFIARSSYKDIELPNLTIPEFFALYHGKYEKFVAIECAQTKRRYTYGDVRTKSTNLSKAFKKIFKLNEQDVVGVVLTNLPEYPIANLGILKANLITTTISPWFTPEEISRQLINSNTKAIITEVDLVPSVLKAVQLAEKNIPIITVKTKIDQFLPEKTINFHELVATTFDYPEIKPCDPENIAHLPYSSGTTGLPKGVELTHNNLVANLIQNNHPEMKFMNETTENFQEILPTILPLYHVFGNAVLMHGMTIYGAKLVTLSKFDRNLYISLLKNYRKSSIIYLVPPIVLFLVGDDRVKKEYLENVRVVFSGAAPLSASDEQRVYEKFGDQITVLQGYGLSETSPVVTSLFPKIMSPNGSHRGSIGKPIINTLVKIVEIGDETLKPLAANKSGELLVKGPQVMKGYHNLPEETKAIKTEDGWLRTGDIGYYNDDGFFFISDRIKELIKVKGNQVAPAELEGIIREYPGILDAAVIGIPHETSGEIPRAYIVTKNGRNFDTNGLKEFVAGKVAKYKRLVGGVVVVDEIPKNASGKILRRKIKEEFLNTDI